MLHPRCAAQEKHSSIEPSERSYFEYEQIQLQTAWQKAIPPPPQIQCVVAIPEAQTAVIRNAYHMSLDLH
jgi:hypothetical protein